MMSPNAIAPKVVEDAPTPADANERLVRTYARKVRSEARWSRATEPVFCRVSERVKGSPVGAVATSSILCLDEDVEGLVGEG